MSYTTIYRVPEQGHLTILGEAHNSWHSAPYIWEALHNEYLYTEPEPEPYQHHWQWRSSWKLSNQEDIPIPYRITLMTTFDRVMVKRENIPEVIDAFANFSKRFPYANNLGDQINILHKGLDDNTLFAVCWRQTSVTDAWQILDKELDEYRYYDLARDTGHWFMFRDPTPPMQPVPDDH